jgi:prephenate dehydrogenase
MKIHNLETLRKAINKIDEAILKLLVRRIHLGKDVAAYKNKRNLPYTDSEREQEMIKRLSSITHHAVLKEFIPQIFTELMVLNKTIRMQTVTEKKAITIGIIGYGRFAQTFITIFTKHLSGVTLLVFSRTHAMDNKMFYSLSKVCSCDIVIPCVPISALQHVLRKMKPLLGEKTVVIDVCSVKVKPVEWMKKILGRNVALIASHPMFGPDSTHEGENLLDLNMMLYNISAPPKIYTWYKQFWEKLGMNIIEITPQQHDKYAAYSINYNHLIGRIGQLTGIKPTPIDTKGFQVIYDALTYVTNDTWQLFIDMQRYNPYAREMRKKVVHAMGKIETIITKGIYVP